MEDIDDVYVERREALENEFFEDFKRGKRRSEVVQSYHTRLEKLISFFEHEYTKRLDKDIRLAKKVKPLKKEREHYEHLEVSHLEFTHSFWERCFAHWSLFWFRTGRFFRRMRIALLPSSFLYHYYSITLSLKLTFRGVTAALGTFFHKVGKLLLLLIGRVWAFIVFSWQKIFTLFKRIMSSILSRLSRKKSEGESTSKKEEEHGDEQQNKS